MRRLVTRLIVIALVIGLTGFAASSSPVLAVPAIQVTPQTGSPGTSVTITGSGFFASETGITVTWDGAVVQSGILADTQGNWFTIFVIPPAASGIHTIDAFGSQTGAAAVPGVPFSVHGAISTNRNTGPTGTSVTVTGSGFGLSETGITVTYDGTALTPNLTASSLGGWSTTITIPASASGSHTIDARGNTTLATTVADQTFTVTPSISTSRTSGSPGSTATITGTGFAANETGITVTYDGTALASNLTANAQGGWSTTITIPPSTAGAHAIDASGNITSAATITGLTFTTGASISASRTTGPPGTSVTITGSGFGAGETGIVVTYDGTALTPNLTASAQGGWSTTITIPPSTAGSHTIDAAGAITTATAIADITFTTTPTIAISRTSGTVGSPLTVSGSGFGANETGIVVTLDGSSLGSGVSASAQGGWSTNVVLPAAASGPHIIDARGTTTLGASVSDLTFNVLPLVTINRVSGSPGTSVTVTGSGFGASESGITVTFDGTTVASGITANAQGGWTANLSIPASISGPHTIDTFGTTTAVTSVQDVSFTVGPSIVISRTSGSPGNMVTVTGAGFGANEAGITVTYDGTAVASNISTNAQGGWSTTFTVPASPSGPHTIDASGAVTAAAAVIDLTFTTGPTIAISRTSGNPGSSLTVTGAGFGPSEAGITISLDGSTITSNISANAQGGWSTTFTIPVVTSGAHTIDAFGATTAAAAVPDMAFTVTPTMSISRTSGTPGSSATVSGAGFGANEAGIIVTWDGSPAVTGILANAQGSWSTTLTIPASASGPHAVKASSSITQIASSEVSFHVTPVASVTPASGYVGTTVEISGSGFAANSPVTISYDDKEIATGATDTSGSFSKSIVVPQSLAGPHIFRALDGQKNESKASFAMDSTPPPVPGPRSPGDGIRIGLLGGATPTFGWSSVSDTSGVSYVFQIDTHPDFSQPILERTVLSGSHYTLTAAEALPLGTYYWRVKAIDGASNQSAWSQPWLVKSGLMPLWGLLLIVVLAAVVVGGVVYFIAARVAMRRRRAYAIPGTGEPEIGTVTGQWRPLEPEAGPGERPIPWRLALPEASKGKRPFSTEEQARMKVLLDFARSLPLVEPGYNVKWLMNLVENGLGLAPSTTVYEQLLNGELQVRYEPAWMHHPTYHDLTTVLEGQNVLYDLNAFIDAANHCVSEATLLLQEIYRDATAEIPSGFLERGGWEFTAAVYADALNWFLGKSLRDPSERDYAIKPRSGPGEGNGALWLYGEETTPFAGPLVKATDEKEWVGLRALHLKLRRAYRSNQRAREVADWLTQLDVQRGRLLTIFAQLGRLKP
ncbi:MAG: IPT/TIG domain-containing protein [Chloroflexi bacterium]|nr:IPT/TIG domain-containing protein [Chloroflexota bacterium]